ncbi:ATP-binding protein [Roseivirga pacifica]|uniref:ATP-binding protein n=1 Tax=Roseivirga pacifica TaxID=1267423 RepID=UPI003BAEF3AD
MREINLLSLLQSSASLTENYRSRYYRYLNVKPKPIEIEGLKSLVNEIRKVKRHPYLFDQFYFNYSIPQIGKEFDLLRFGQTEILNIELKSQSTVGLILKQLTENKHYLSFLNKNIHSFTYVSAENQLYTLNDQDEIETAQITELIDRLWAQDCIKIDNLDSLFDPTNYLISPFNSTREFVEKGYFLTHQQETIKGSLVGQIENEKNSFFAIHGKPGTGKTLLIYDIAQEFMEQDLNVLVIQCGMLNSGHLSLINDHNWNIVPIKSYREQQFDQFDLVVLDEAQRIRPGQLKYIIAQIKKYNGTCIFSYDRRQCLTKREKRNEVEQIIIKGCAPDMFELTQKIRTNKEVASFITGLFDKNKSINKVESQNIQLNYFDNIKDAKSYIELLRHEDWKLINYTPSSYQTLPYMKLGIPDADTAHEVIGQEFDDVVCVLDSHFTYDDGKLIVYGYKELPYYDPVMMLFQIITRVRKRLNIIIIDNPLIMERCLNLIRD